MAARKPQIDAEQFALISKALGDPSRLEMLKRIAASDEPPTCTCIREWIGLSPATVSHHLKELENAGLVRVQRDGKFGYLTLRREVLEAYTKMLSAL